MKILIFTIIVLCPKYFHATQNRENISIKNIELFIDTNKSMNLNNIITNAKFNQIKNGYSIPNKVANYWFKLKISTNKPFYYKHYLSILTGVHFDLNCYYFNDSLITQKSGLLYKKNKDTKNPTPTFEIITNKEEIDIYIKCTSKGFVETFLFKIMDEKSYDDFNQSRQFTFGLYYGILILIFIINLFYYFSIKQKAFLFYSIYILLTLFFSSYNDKIPLLGLLNTSGSLHPPLLFASVILYIGILPLMSIHYLQLETNKKLLNKTYIYLAFSILSCISVFIWNNDSFIANSFLYHNFTILISFIFVIFIGVKGYKANVLLGRTFFFAILIVILSILIPSLDEYGLISFNFGFDLVKLGSLIEIIILSLVLALHFKGIKKDLTIKSIKLDNLSNDYEKKEKEFFNLEDRFLSSQMNPHFTFNAMNSILHFMLENESEKAQNYLTKYSKLIRKVMENSMNKYVYLNDEIRLLQLYLDMEKTRLFNKFNSTIHISQEINNKTILIPPMLIQPFVENAIWHGIAHKEDNLGLISLSFLINEDYIKCSIEDNGIGREKAKELNFTKKTHQSIGMSITKQRLEHLLLEMNVKPNIIDLKDENNVSIGTKVEIYIPIQHEQKK